MTDVFRDLCSSLIYLLETHCRAEELAINDVASTMDRARAALSAAPAPAAITTNALLHPAYEPGDGSMDGAQLVNSEWWHPVFGCDSLQHVVDNARAIARQCEAAPAPAAKGEVAELVAEIRHFLAGYKQMLGLDPENIYSIHRGDAMEARLTVSRLTRAADLLEHLPRSRASVKMPTTQELFALWEVCNSPSVFARQLLARYGNRTPTPISVNDRLPGAEDCDGEGRLWIWTKAGAIWRWQLVYLQFTNLGNGEQTHWLPHWALPLPEVEA